MALREDMQTLLDQREKLNCELNSLVRNALHEKLEHPPRPGARDPQARFYADKISFFQLDNLKLQTVIEAKKKRVAEGEVHIEKLTTELETKQKDFEQLTQELQETERQLGEAREKITQCEGGIAQAKERIEHFHQQEKPLKAVLDQNIGQLVSKKSAVALLETQKALQTDQFEQSSKNAQKLVERLARAQNENAETSRSLHISPQKQGELAELREKVQRQQQLQKEKKKLVSNYSRLVKQKTDYLEKYKRSIVGVGPAGKNESSVFRKVEKFTRKLEDHPLTESL